MDSISQKIMDITGFLIPIEWDKHQNVVKVGIMTDRFEKYIIAESETLFSEHLNKKIKATVVVVGEDLTGNNVIRLIKHKLVN